MDDFNAVQKTDSNSHLTVFILIGVNCIPLIGTLFFKWDAMLLMLLYWTENLIVGFYHAVKLACIPFVVPAEEKQGHEWIVMIMLILFFCILFGGFCAGHGFFLYELQHFSKETSLFNEMTWPMPLLPFQIIFKAFARTWEYTQGGLLLFAASLMVSHGISFYTNFLKGREYYFYSNKDLIGKPFKRVLLMQLAVIIGAMPALLLKSPVFLLLCLVVLKTGVDVWSHSRSHKTPKDYEETPEERECRELLDIVYDDSTE